MTISKYIAAVALMIPAATAKFKPVGPAPYSPTVARQKIKALMIKVDAPNRPQTIMTLSGLLSWFRDIIDDELIAAWKKDEGRQNLPDVVGALADARVGSAVVEFSWRERREATFNLTNAPLFGNLMLRFPDSAKPFLDDLLAPDQSALKLTEAESYAVCRILIDMPDIGAWRKNGAQILPHYREAAETLLAADRNGGDQETRNRAQYWTSVLRTNAVNAMTAQGQRVTMQDANAPKPSILIDETERSGTLECSGPGVEPNAEYVFPNVTTAHRKFDYDRKIWDLSFVTGEGGQQNMVLKNRSSRTQKRCSVRWTISP